MQTVLCENHFFESRLFGLSELHLALLGSSRPLPGQSWGPDGTQNRLKSDPKIGPKMSPKMDAILSSSWANFGVILGPSWLLPGLSWFRPGGTFFKVFRIVSRAPFWPYLGLILAPSWPLLGSSWAQLGPSWPHLGPILASSWPSWPFLAPSWPLLGPVLALLAALGPILALLGLLGSWVLFWGSTGALFGFSWGSLGLSWASPTEVAPTTAATAAAVKAAVADSGLHYLWAIYMGMGWGGTYDHHFCHCFI